MRGNEFIERIQKLARQRNVECRVDQKRGKGSHVTLYYGTAFTIVRNPKEELKTGTMNAMLRQLCIKKEEI